jgi:hypothetical protein
MEIPEVTLCRIRADIKTMRWLLYGFPHNDLYVLLANHYSEPNSLMTRIVKNTSTRMQRGKPTAMKASTDRARGAIITLHTRLSIRSH